MKKPLLNIAFLILSVSLYAQTSISGKVVDADTKEPLVSANVIIAETTNGVATNETGRFTISNISAGTYVIKVSYLGYQSAEKEITVGTNPVTVNFSLKSTEVSLSSVLIEANKAKERETPVAFSELKAEEISLNLGARDVPMVLNTIPGVYATMSGGGSGDSRINVRGFNQRNFAVMINGVPVNDMENGAVFWSNWSGLGDVAKNIQVQRGLGATPYSVSSIGGLLNIQTFSTERAKSAKLKLETGSYNLQKKTAVFSTGVMENGIAMTGMFSHKTSDGYADRTWTDEFTYFLTLGTRFENQTLDFTIVGSPQRHGQRFAKQTIDVWGTRSKTYNTEWGMLNGKELDRAVNFYHKPAMNLNHNWQINDQMLLATVAYASFGTGGGTGGLGATSPSVKTDGTLDWDGLYATNAANATGSKGILRASRNDHNWYGLVSTLKYNLDDNLTLTTGIDGRYYKGIHFREITNLIGGKYFLDSKNLNRDPKTELHVGDKVDYYNDGIVRQFGGFGQLEFKQDDYTAFANLSLSQTSYKRVDYFFNRDKSKTAASFSGTDSVAKYYAYLNNLSPAEIGFENFIGYTIKGGANYNFTESQNVFFNAGYYSKAPGFDGVFSNDHTTYENIENEKILSTELGYGFRGSNFAINANAYLTQWKDKFIVQRFTDPLDASKLVYFYIPGVDATHEGIEFEGRYIMTPEVEFNLMYTLSLNEWKKNVETTVKNDSGRVLGTKKVFIDGVYVGDSPMTSVALSVVFNYDIDDKSSVRFNPSINYYARNYANFSPETRDTEAKYKRADGSIIQPWRMPDYSLVNLNSSYELNFDSFAAKKMTLSLSIFNALNQSYISDADDGSVTHNEIDSKVFYGGERFYTLGLSFDF